MRSIRVPLRTKEAFDHALASTNRMHFFRPCRDLGFCCDRDPSVKTLGYFQDQNALSRYLFRNVVVPALMRSPKGRGRAFQLRFLEPAKQSFESQVRSQAEDGSEEQ